MDYRQTDISRVHPNLRRFAEYCQGLAKGGVMARAGDFRLSEAHWLFGFINIVDVINGGEDYRYASCGTFWKLILGFDLTGARLSEMEAVGRLKDLRDNYDHTVAAGAPRYRAADLYWPGGPSLHLERLVVPFAGPDGKVSMLTVAAQCNCSLQELFARHSLGEARLVLEPSRRAEAA